MNKIILLGNLCKELELKYTTNNKAVMQNTIAVKNDYKNAAGEYDSQFINIVIWGKSAEYLKNYGTKGSKVLVEGRLQNRTYDKQDGTKGYVTEVIVEKVVLLNNSTKKQEQPVEKTKLSDDTFAEFGTQIEITDEDLAF